MRFFLKLIGKRDDQVADWSSEVNIKLLRNKVMDIIKEVDLLLYSIESYFHHWRLR